ncbi:Trichohyalin [Giardia muris]|uniref:Trichohyalin n=1 Tax=Giardia muris TaxID=5742 RepID=A0A4Z1SY69_GIAMU|nr:Trichohyalin [Giardia muris]|eukprot:TNJ30636.1 Trichohyalin [Giardia muris]
MSVFNATDRPSIYASASLALNAIGSTTYMQNGNIVYASPMGIVRVVPTSQGAKFDKICQLGEHDQVIVCIRAHPQENILAVAVSGSIQSFISFVDTDSMERLYDMPWPTLLGEPSGLCFSPGGDILAVTTRSPAGIYFARLELDVQLIVAGIEGVLPGEIPFAPQYFVADPSVSGDNEASFVVDVGMIGLYVTLKWQMSYTRGSAGSVANNFTCSAQYIVPLAGATSMDFIPFYTNQYIVGGYPDSSLSLIGIVRHPNEPEPVSFGSLVQCLPTKHQSVAGASPLPFTPVLLQECLVTKSTLTFQDITKRVQIPFILPKNIPTPRFGVSAIRGIVGGTVYVILKSGVFCSFYISSLERRGLEYSDISSDEDDDSDKDDGPAPRAPPRERVLHDATSTAKTEYLKVALSFSACVVLNADGILCDSGRNGTISSLLSRATAAMDELTAWGETRSNIIFCSLTVDRTDLTTLACIVYDPITGSAIPAYVTLPQVNNRTATQSILKPLATPFISVFGYVHLNTIQGAGTYLRQVSQLCQLASRTASQIRPFSNASGRASQLGSSLEVTKGEDAAGGFETDTIVQLFGQSTLVPCISSSGRYATRIAFVDASFAFSVRRVLMATANGTVRLYEYTEDSFSVVGSVKLMDTITAVSCHPLGYLAAVATTDSIRIVTVDADSLVIDHEIGLKMTTSLSFSQSGGILIVIRGSSTALYDIWSKHCLGTLEGHNDAVIDVVQLPNENCDEAYFVTASRDGMLYLWTAAGERVSEIIGRIRFTSLSAFNKPDPDFGRYPPVLACGNGCIHVCDFNSNLILFVGYYSDEVDGNVVCIRNIMYDDSRDIIYASDIDGYIYALSLPEDFKSKCLGIVKCSREGMVGSDLQPTPAPIPRADMRFPGTRFACPQTTPENTLQTNLGGAGSAHKSVAGSGAVTPRMALPSRGKGRGLDSAGGLPSSDAPSSNVEPIEPVDSAIRSRLCVMPKITRTFEEIQRVRAPLVARFSLSPDRKFLTVTSLGLTGSFYIIQLPGLPKQCIQRRVFDLTEEGEQTINENGFLDTDVIVDEGYLIALKKILLVLVERTKEAELEFEHTVRVVNQRHEKAAQAEKTLSNQELESARQRTDLLINNAEREAEQYEAELHSLDRMHSAALEKLEAQYRVKVQTSNEKQERLKAELEASQNYLADMLADLKRQRDTRIENTIANYEREEEQVRKRLVKLDSDRKQLRKEYQELLRQGDEDADVQLQELQSRYNAQLEELYTRTNGVSAETGMIKNKFQTIEKSILTYQGSLLACENTLHSLEQTNENLKHEIQLARAEAEARNEAIVSREKLIYSLKKEAKDLEKHRFVLDFKIKELRKCIEPRETEISDLKEQIRELGNELENFHKATTVLEHVIQEHRDESANLKKTLFESKSNDQSLRNRLSHLEHDICELVEGYGSISLAELKKRCRGLFDQYGGFTIIDSDAASAATEKELHQQYLVNAIDTLNRELQRSKAATTTENARIVEENAELLKEAAVLRREIQKILHGPITQQNTENSKVFAARLTAQEAEIKRLKKRIVELQNSESQ